MCRPNLTVGASTNIITNNEFIMKRNTTSEAKYRNLQIRQLFPCGVNEVACRKNHYLAYLCVVPYKLGKTNVTFFIITQNISKVLHLANLC